ncbi:LINOLEATE 13S-LIPOXYGENASE 2-1 CHLOROPLASTIC [Salix viminalis]|uniref:LINOLEATE 13S-LIPOXYGENASE 2-1 CHLOROPLASTIC n=1 Tax=Salix viminalis TaxID=40686 RepID=A0A9Q0TLW5_SALVM|nr:LINOLEATE 13S-LIPOXYGENASE 2-1 CHLOROPLASTIC [Salix viminalis]
MLAGQLNQHFSPGKYSMELSSVVYDKQWRFDHQGLPMDLISRGMAIEDPTSPHGLKLAVEDYPYANDGLELWAIIKKWVSDYANHYYPEASLIESDSELLAWWEEVRTVGHGDKKDEPWWPELRTPQDLIEIITTIVWVASGHHAAVNFGQYAYAGYFPNRPPITRRKMPNEDPKDEDWKLFLEKPVEILLETFPSQLQAATVMVALKVLSEHSPDEEYLGEKIEPVWAEDPVIKSYFEKFHGSLIELERIIDRKNADENFVNRHGAGVMPYELLKPFSKPGITGQGVPYSISI